MVGKEVQRYHEQASMNGFIDIGVQTNTPGHEEDRKDGCAKRERRPNF